MVTLVRLEQLMNALSPMEVTPSPIVTVWIPERFESHGKLELYVKFSIAPVPLMVSVPASSSVQVRLLPSPSAPQVPLATSAARAVTGRRLSAIQTASRLAKNFLFINFPLSSVFSSAVPPLEAGPPAPRGIPAEANKSGAGQKNPTPHIRHKSPKPPLAKGAAILYNGDWRSKLLLCRRVCSCIGAQGVCVTLRPAFICLMGLLYRIFPQNARFFSQSREG